MKLDAGSLILAICLIVSLSATVVVAVVNGGPAIAGPGLGALTASLAGALIYRVKMVNGKAT
jgi:hypothetical protein